MQPLRISGVPKPESRRVLGCPVYVGRLRSRQAICADNRTIDSVSPTGPSGMFSRYFAGNGVAAVRSQGPRSPFHRAQSGCHGRGNPNSFPRCSSAPCISYECRRATRSPGPVRVSVGSERLAPDLHDCAAAGHELRQRDLRPVSDIVLDERFHYRHIFFHEALRPFYRRKPARLDHGREEVVAAIISSAMIEAATVPQVRPSVWKPVAMKHSVASLPM